MDAGQKLDMMANQIATFFHSYPEAEAVAGVHEHLLSFWTPRMRGDLRARLEAGTARLDPLAAQAVQGLVPPVEAPTARAAASPAAAGGLGAVDAG